MLHARAVSPLPIGAHLPCWHRRTPFLGCHAQPPSSHPLSRNAWNVEVIQGFMPREVSAVARLLAEIFGQSPTGSDDDDDDPVSETQLKAYQFKLMGVLHMRAATEGHNFTTLIARAHGADAASAPPDGAPLAGVATVAPGLGPADADGHMFPGLEQGSLVASISNMAVHPMYRRQGLGRALLCAAEAATMEWDEPPAALALSVYRYNEAAVRLYQGAGYQVDPTWTDQRWLRSAERGRVGFEQRQLMVKRRI